MVVFMVACGLQKIYTVLQSTSTSDLGAHYLLSARSTSGISPCWRAVRGCLKSPDSVIFQRLCFHIPASKQMGRTLVRAVSLDLRTFQTSSENMFTRLRRDKIMRYEPFACRLA